MPADLRAKLDREIAAKLGSPFEPAARRAENAIRLTVLSRRLQGQT
jgi:hypothetical protein